MQAIDKSGIYQGLEEFSVEKLKKRLEDPNVSQVDIFPGTPENIERRKALVGKKYKPSKGFKKAPKIKEMVKPGVKLDIALSGDLKETDKG